LETFAVDVRSIESVGEVIDRFEPDAIVNAVGVVKQRDEAKQIIPSLEINALFPHRLLEVCKAAGVRLMHVSTDCVFSGRKGNYTEKEIPDPVDLYGRTKLLGELDEAPGITLRTSIIGLELRHKTGLIEWYLARKGTIPGFRRAIYSGFTTLEMARVIERILVRHSDLFGVWHVASAPISKYALLKRLTDVLGRRDIKIEPDDTFVCDRSLCGRAFEEATGYSPPPWEEMLLELARQVREREV
jgi:dTDP-4-dehydrorhamnose reductase